MKFNKGRQGPACVIRNVDHGAFERERRDEVSGMDRNETRGKEKKEKGIGE